MIPYRQEKIENAVCFFADEHRKKTRHHLYQLFLYKYLALFDFGHLREFGRPALGLTYVAMKRGPVPKELYDRRDDPALSSRFAFQKNEAGEYFIRPQGVPDLDYFSRHEIDRMHHLVEIYAQRYMSAELISDASHQEILAWKRTWDKKQNDLIDFSLEFPGNVFEKPSDELTFPEETFLIQTGLDRCISLSAT